MRIGCLQFAPQVGDLENNLNRADAVLSRASPENLDLLVLPELAFTGYNFKSLQHISPFLEPSGSGISALWARTNALKYNCVVCVGYPEKVDPTPNWPTSPEYYNSVIIVNEDGETVANYRKCHLYYTDETWALEGQDGFFEGYIPGLGYAALGICMDINPYKFEAPWNAFEFAYHILEVEANVVILSMAWLTREDGRSYSRMPKEPDMETLTYWVQRLEPVIRHESNEEIIVIFCNRTGIEGDAVYAGTSAVIGIKDGEVNVYGLLGRGEKELLVVDTNNPVYAKLVYRPEEEEERAVASEGSEIPHHSGPRSTTSSVVPTHGGRDSGGSSFRSGMPTGSSLRDNGEQSSSLTHLEERSTRHKRARPTIDIPERRGGDGQGATILTPTAPSPTPSSLRPKVNSEAPSGSSARAVTQVATPLLMNHPRNSWDSGRGYAFDSLPPTTPFEDTSPASPHKFFWVPSENLLKSPAGNVAGSSTSGSDLPRHVPKEMVNGTAASVSGEKEHGTPAPFDAANGLPRTSSPEAGSHDKGLPRSRTPGINGERFPDRPSSPKSRNASRPRFGDRSDSSLSQRPDLSFITSRLEALNRPDSAMGRPRARSETPQPHGDTPERPSSPKSRNASRSRPDFDGRASVMSGASIYIGAAQSLLDGEIRRGSPAPARPDSRLARRSDSPEAFYRFALYADRPFQNPFSTQPPESRGPEAASAGDAMTGSSSAADSQLRREGLQTRIHNGSGDESESNGPDPTAPHRHPAVFPGFQAQPRPLFEEFERIEGVISPDCPLHGGHGSVAAQSGRSSGNNDPANGHGGGSSTEQGGRTESQGGDGGGAPGTPAATEASGETEPTGTAGGPSQSEADSGTSPQSAPSPETNPVAHDSSTWDSAGASSAAGPSQWTSADTNSAPKLSPSSINTSGSTGRLPATPLVGSTTPKAMTIIRDDDKLIIGYQPPSPGTGVSKTHRSVELELTPLPSSRPESTV